MINDLSKKVENVIKHKNSLSREKNIDQNWTYILTEYKYVSWENELASAAFPIRIPFILTSGQSLNWIFLL